MSLSSGERGQEWDSLILAEKWDNHRHFTTRFCHNNVVKSPWNILGDLSSLGITKGLSYHHSKQLCQVCHSQRVKWSFLGYTVSLLSTSLNPLSPNSDQYQKLISPGNNYRCLFNPSGLYLGFFVCGGKLHNPHTVSRIQTEFLVGHFCFSPLHRKLTLRPSKKTKHTEAFCLKLSRPCLAWNCPRSLLHNDAVYTILNSSYTVNSSLTLFMSRWFQKCVENLRQFEQTLAWRNRS